MVTPPALNPALTAEERRAVAEAWARRSVTETLAAEGIDRARVDMARLEAEAVALVLAHWLDAALAPVHEAAP